MKAFLKTTAGKICIGALALILAAGLIIGGVFLWQYLLPKFQDITVELGITSVTADMFLSEHGDAEKAAFVTAAEDIVFDKVGTTEVTLVQDGKEETVLLTVQDTTVPQVTFRDHSVAINGTVDTNNFIDEAFDYSELTYTMTGELVPNENYDSTTVTVTVTDACGNKVSKECTLSFLWTNEVVLELGTPLTKEQLLIYPEKDGDTIDQAHIDLLNGVGAGEYQIPAIKNGRKHLCTITIQDTVAPQLEVKDLSILQGENFTVNDLVVSATDLSQVTLRFLEEPSVEPGTYTVTIEAEDASGNITALEATLEIVPDTEAPVFKGGNTIYTGKNGNPDYTSGISVTDNADSDITFTYDAGAVKISQAGTYYVTYTATDKAGNTATFRRKVEIAHDQADLDALIANWASKCGNTIEGINKYIRDNIWYNHDWGGSDPVWYGFTTRGGNCYVHALCLKAVLEYKDYQTQLIWVKEQYDPHYWLLVYVDGVGWRHIDPTPGVHKAHLMTDAQRYANLQGRDWDRSQWPACE